MTERARCATWGYGNRDPKALFFPEAGAGGFSRVDGTLQFYSRVHALLTSESTVVDFGAGRGQLNDDLVPYRRSLADLRGRAAKVVGVDVDPVVHENPLLDEAVVYDGDTIPISDASVDVVVSKWVLEHLQDPETFAREMHRILRPGGWLCAVTPNLIALSSLATLLTPNALHGAVLRWAQPGREERDVFPVTFKLNTLRAVRRHFPKAQWSHHSYSWSSEPAYYFGNKLIYAAFLAYQAVKRPFLGGETLMIFVQKR